LVSAFSITYGIKYHMDPDAATYIFS